MGSPLDQFHDLDWHGEHNGVGSRGAKAIDGLERAKLHGTGTVQHDGCGTREILGGQSVPFRLGDGRSLFPLGTRPPLHDPAEILWHVDVHQADAEEVQARLL